MRRSLQKGWLQKQLLKFAGLCPLIMCHLYTQTREQESLANGETNAFARWGGKNPHECG